MLVRPNVISKEKTREGRGFSKQEINAAGLNILKAKKMGIAIDKKRRTVYEENIKILEYIKESK